MTAATLLTTLLVAVAAAAPNGGGISTSIASKQTCITKYRPALDTVSPLQTKTRTSAQQVSSTVTTCGQASTTTVTVTPDPITSTILVNATSSLLPAAAFVTLPAKAANVCSVTTTISSGTTTHFTGVYNATLARRTVSPQPIDQRRTPMAAKVFHHFGQRTLGTKQQPFAVLCLNQATTYQITTTTIAEQPATETVTAKTPTVYVTKAQRAVLATTGPASITSTMTAPPATGGATNGVCTVTVAKSTTTQHVKCAPTNLISSVNNYGIGQTGGDSASTRGLAPGSDPSACCQLCMDDQSCAASEDDHAAGNCFLWYTTPSCGLGFRYSDGGQKLAPGSGLIVQTGCGSIEAVASF